MSNTLLVLWSATMYIIVAILTSFVIDLEGTPYAERHNIAEVQNMELLLGFLWPVLMPLKLIEPIIVAIIDWAWQQ